MGDYRDDKLSRSDSFWKILIFDLLIVFFSFLRGFSFFILYLILAASPRRHILIVDDMDRRPPYSRLRRSVINLPCDNGFYPPFLNPHNKLTIIPSNICLEQVFCTSVVSYFLNFDKGGPMQLGVVFFMFSYLISLLKFELQFIYQKLHPYRSIMTWIYVFNMPRAVLCSFALLINDL